MPKRSISLTTMLLLIILLTACAGPEKKLGRGISNVTEFARFGEMRRSMEQTGVWGSPDQAYTKGFLRGLGRSLARTAVGGFEIATFPFPTPTYDPLFLPADPVYPDSYTPGLLADPTFAPDSALGFSGGDIAPFAPGSRLHVFDY